MNGDGGRGRPSGFPGAISVEVNNPPSGTNPTPAPTNSSRSHHESYPSQDQTQATGPLIKKVSSSVGSTSGAATATPPKVLGFIPNYKGAAEVGARRRVWLEARRSFSMGTGGAQPARPLSLCDLDSSSSASEPEPHSDIEGNETQTNNEDLHNRLPADSAEEDGFDSVPVIGGNVDLAHEFDP